MQCSFLSAPRHPTQALWIFRILYSHREHVSGVLPQEFLSHRVSGQVLQSPKQASYISVPIPEGYTHLMLKQVRRSGAT